MEEKKKGFWPKFSRRNKREDSEDAVVIEDSVAETPVLDVSGDEEVAEIIEIVDVGKKKKGVMQIKDSSSDLLNVAMIPQARLNPYNKIDAELLFVMIDKNDAGGLVLGLPLNMDGTEGPRCQSTRQFAQNLLGIRDIPIAFWDERLSTAAVQRMKRGDAGGMAPLAVRFTGGADAKVQAGFDGVHQA